MRQSSYLRQTLTRWVYRSAFWALQANCSRLLVQLLLMPQYRSEELGLFRVLHDLVLGRSVTAWRPGHRLEPLDDRVQRHIDSRGVSEDHLNRSHRPMDVLGRLLEAVGKDSEVSDRVHCALAVHAHLPSSFGNDRVDSLLETAALDVDADDLTELWWAVQGMVEVEDRVGERTVRLWWRELWAEPQVELDHHRADAEAKRRWTPAEDYRVPSLRLFVLANEIRLILRRLLGASWRVDYRPEIGLRDPIEGRPAEVMIELRVVVEEGDSERPSELTATFACPEPVARPAAPKPTTRPKTEAMPPDVAWILTAVEAMPARERASVAAFIHGLREGASLYSENNRPSP